MKLVATSLQVYDSESEAFSNNKQLNVHELHVWNDH